MNLHAPRIPSPRDAQRLRDVRLLVSDFDGVWTTNQVLVLEDGREGVLCNRSDGLGVGMLRESGPELVVLSAEVNPVVSRRCEKLGVACVQGKKDKAAALATLLREKGVGPEHVAYIGNDVNDLPCMRAVGLSIAVADSWPSVLEHATFITSRPGGLGALREVCEWFVMARRA